MDRAGSQPGRGSVAAGEAPPRYPAGLRGQLDLRLRRRHDRIADRRHRLGRDPRHQGADLVARFERRPLLQQPSPLGRRGLLLHDGRPPVGQVLHGRLARRALVDLGHRRGAVPDRDRHRLHRLPLAAELRFAMDRQRGQGRAQLGRHRQLLQRHRLRPDVHLPRHPAARRRGGARGMARAARPQARGRAAVPGQAAAAGAGADEGRQ